MKRTCVIVIMYLGTLCSATYGGSSSRRPLANLVPADGVVVFSVNWEIVSRDGELKKLVKGGEVEQLFRQLSVASAEVSELALFSDGRGAPGGVSGMLLRGAFDSAEALARLKDRGWAEQKFGRATIYTYPSDGTCAVVLRRKVLAFRTKAGVEGAIKPNRIPARVSPLTPRITGCAHTHLRTYKSLAILCLISP